MTSSNPDGYGGLAVYYGDLHNHCGLSYGHGPLAAALHNAHLQLDFASVTVHAVWPDLPSGDAELSYLVDYHEKGFAQASAAWPEYLAAMDSANQDGSFVTFPSFEWHSMYYGDHCVYYRDGAGGAQARPIVNAGDLPALRRMVKELRTPAFMIPHHIGYIRVSTDQQDLAKQEHLLLKYAQQHEMQIDDFIQMEISSRRTSRERRIDELLTRLNQGDVLLVAELSRLGRNMFEVINLINRLGERGEKLIFVRQPELSTAGPHRKLLLAIYSYFAEAEREFISVRTKQGLAAARAKGKKLGRPKGSRDKERILDPHREQIKEYLQLRIPLRRIRSIINPQLERRSAIRPIGTSYARIQNCLSCGNNKRSAYLRMNLAGAVEIPMLQRSTFLRIYVPAHLSGSNAGRVCRQPAKHSSSYRDANTIGFLGQIDGPAQQPDAQSQPHHTEGAEYDK